MYILGINAYHPDSSACLLKDGRLVAAVEEERFRRLKHWAGFPRKAIEYCLKEAGIELSGLDYVALNRDIKANIFKKALFVLLKRPGFGLIKSRVLNIFKIQGVKNALAKEFGFSEKEIRAKVVKIEHHLAHLASSFFVSPFLEAAVVSLDAFGDFCSLKVARGERNKIKEIYQVNYPHSLGIFYSALTQFLGFKNFGDEFKVMGLAAYGKPKYLGKMEKIVRLKPKGKFELDLNYFSFYQNGQDMSWDNAQPRFSNLYSQKLVDEFCQPRKQKEKITAYHVDLTSSLQAMYEKALFHILNYAHKATGSNNLCLAGGCALNSLANGKILQKTPFENIYIQPASSDAGGSLGASLYLYCQILGFKREFEMNHAFFGPSFSEKEIEESMEKNLRGLENLKIEKIEKEEELVKKTAKMIAQSKIVGWFQGRLEWGPRALGNRSILADPRKKEIREIINKKIKFREWFRPFGPSVLKEAMPDYFENPQPDPFMVRVYKVKKEKQKEIPAVLHKDNTCRVQSVSKETSPLYWRLIEEFKKLSGVPLLLNTSFNAKEPIVCTPKEAIDCFLRTKMDSLVMGNFIIQRL